MTEHTPQLRQYHTTTMEDMIIFNTCANLLPTKHIFTFSNVYHLLKAALAVAQFSTFITTESDETLVLTSSSRISIRYKSYGVNKFS